MLGLGEFPYFHLPKSFPLLECEAAASGQFDLWTRRNCNERSPQFLTWACFCVPANHVSLPRPDSFSVRADLACLSAYQNSALYDSIRAGILCSAGLPISICLIKGQLCSQTCMQPPSNSAQTTYDLLLICRDTNLNYSSEMIIQYTDPFPAFRHPESVEPS
jgi:hypothetical protein